VTGTAGPTIARRLLARLRDVMAGGGSAQERLDKVVKLIAANMVAEVCSCYVLRAGEVLELFATEGLTPSAVHKTRLRVGEGLVGDIAAHARALALADAQSHPNFAYRPETGEEIYKSLMGVPIIRGSRVLGVLVVQNRTRRNYSEEEVETLETVAMVLAELVASGELVSRDEQSPVDGNAVLPLRMDGVRLVAGVGIGRAILHQPRVVITQYVAENPEAERERLRAALARMRTHLDELFSASDLGDAGEHREVFEAYLMFAEDSGWIGRISEAIESGLTAEAAVQMVHDDTRLRMSQVSDPYLRERLHDLEDLANRLLRTLAGGGTTAASRADLPDDCVLVCRSMGPTELLDYDRGKLRAIVMEEGSPTMHLTIVARALDIPVVGRVRGLLDRVDTLDPVIVDGTNGQVFVRPSEDVQEMFAESVRAHQRRIEAYASVKDLPAISRDGTPIALMMNAGLLIDLPQLQSTGADGIGLYRTELPFMARASLPDVAAQTALYSKVLDAAAGRPVLFRTLDVGGDKLLPYWNAMEGEENPALGWRSIRITLDRPAVLRVQLRALLRAASGRELSVMFPMIAEVAELERARQVFAREMEREEKRGAVPPSAIRVGTMLEVPALAWQMPALLPRVDFVSVGTNDLHQFMFAMDRGNPRVGERYDLLAPGALKFLGEVARACAAAGVPVSVCGEMAGRPIEAMALVGLGYRTLSMSAASIGPVKDMIRSLDLPELRQYLGVLLDSPDHSVREKLRAFALDHEIAI
jgi:phosphotransferase system enzyme I (PtsP)